MLRVKQALTLQSDAQSHTHEEISGPDIAGPDLWNRLDPSIRSLAFLTSIDPFLARLKTELFLRSN